MKSLDRFMSMLGYVRRDAVAAGVAALQVEIEAFIALKQDSMEAGVQLLAATQNLERALSQRHASQFVTAELAADEMQPQILAELRKQTMLLEVLTKQGDIAATEQFFATSPARQHAAAPTASAGSPAARAATLAAFAEFAPAVTAAAEARFAADPFAPTFELDAGDDAVRVTLYPRPGSVQYLVNVTGPQSSAVKFEGALPKLAQVSRVIESEP